MVSCRVALFPLLPLPRCPAFFFYVSARPLSVVCRALSRSFIFSQRALRVALFFLAACSDSSATVDVRKIKNHRRLVCGQHCRLTSPRQQRVQQAPACEYMNAVQARMHMIRRTCKQASAIHTSHPLQDTVSTTPPCTHPVGAWLIASAVTAVAGILVFAVANLHNRPIAPCMPLFSSRTSTFYGDVQRTSVFQSSIL